MTDVVPAGESPQLTSAIRASNVLTREQKSALARTLDGFVDYLAAESSSPQVGDVISEHAWHNRANWEDDAWEIWETWGWFRHWGRTVSEMYLAVALILKGSLVSCLLHRYIHVSVASVAHAPLGPWSASIRPTSVCMWRPLVQSWPPRSVSAMPVTLTRW